MGCIQKSKLVGCKVFKTVAKMAKPLECINMVSEHVRHTKLWCNGKKKKKQK